MVVLPVLVLLSENFSLYNSGMLTRARKFFMENIVFPKVYMILFLPWVVINSPHDMQG